MTCPSCSSTSTSSNRSTTATRTRLATRCCAESLSSCAPTAGPTTCRCATAAARSRTTEQWQQQTPLCTTRNEPVATASWRFSARRLPGSFGYGAALYFHHSWPNRGSDPARFASSPGGLSKPASFATLEDMNLDRPVSPDPYSQLPRVAALEVSSTSIVNDTRLPEEHVFNGWGFSGGNVSPQLSWSGPPDGTKSFAVTCFDPDAPTPSGFWHWLLVGIPAEVTTLEVGAGTAENAPGGAFHVANDFGDKRYDGAAPTSRV